MKGFAFGVFYLILCEVTFAFRWAVPYHHFKTFKLNQSTGKFYDEKQYLEYLELQSDLPQGFSVGATRFYFQPQEVDKQLPMNLTLIIADEPTDSFAAMFTQNAFPGGPIYVGKDRLQNSKYLQAIIVNNKISNVCPGGSLDFGAGDSELVCQAVSNYFKLDSKAVVFPSSTGIIGWKLPVNAIKEALPTLSGNLQTESILPAAKGITTTDRYPKLRSYKSKNGKWSISGIAKGAGMIEPNMATMLSYILTDLDVPRNYLQEYLNDIVSTSFNAITIDGDQSTSDTVLILSSKKVPPVDSDYEEFKYALTSICNNLSEDLVRNGEGTNHVIKLTIFGCDKDLARDLGRFLLNSSLFKCAIAGCDPNVGRIIASIGSFLGKHGLQNIVSSGVLIKVGGVEIFKNGQFLLDPQKEKLLSDYLLDMQLYDKEIPEESRTFPPHFKSVEIEVFFGNNALEQEKKFTFFGSDLTTEYVLINADYRS